MDKMEQRTRKLQPILKALQPSDDINYESRKEGGKGLTNIKDCVEAAIKKLEEHTKNSKERPITEMVKQKSNKIKRRNMRLKNNSTDTSSDK